jgi:hypothetical protein
MKFCGSRCQQIALYYYHKALCEKDLTNIQNRAQTAFGGKNEVSILRPLAGWPDRISNTYPAPDKGNFCYPDQVTLVLAHAFTICVQAGGHPLENPNIAQMMPSGDTKNPTVAWNFTSMVIAPIEILQTLGVDVFANEQWDSWVVMTIW